MTYDRLLLVVALTSWAGFGLHRTINQPLPQYHPPDEEVTDVAFMCEDDSSWSPHYEETHSRRLYAPDGGVLLLQRGYCRGV